jgi:DNA (cytosine-5)-methyltransferase 1
MPLSVAELFAGVGGFRLGFENTIDVRGEPAFEVVWSNQWEPSTKKQHASGVYVARWGLVLSEDDPDVYLSRKTPRDVHVNKDINSIEAEEIPDIDVLCGGFPCQDYSVAKTADKAKGIQGKKGVLWWDIRRIIEEKQPKIVLLENVDRLLKSPTSQRGRDFAVMLASLDELGYVVEWRSINAADYGFPQRRRRVFILAYRDGTRLHQQLMEADAMEYLQVDGVLSHSFQMPRWQM